MSEQQRERVTQDSIEIAHWGEHCNGGGERVGWELARTFDRPLHVGTKEESFDPDDVDVRELWPDGWPRRAIDHGGLAKMGAYALLWQKDVGALADADTIVTSGNEPLFYVPDGEQTWIAYVHHTGRQQTDLLADRWGSGVKDRVAQCVMHAQRLVLSNNASKPDTIVANSEPVASRINRYWGVPMDDIEVVYPPIPVTEYSRHDAETEDYYLCLSRLDWHKQLADVVKTFNDLGKRLLVAGDGSERDDLEALAGDNVEMLGYVSEERKRELLSGATAVINNALAEDFGITTVEPLAAGTPVLGVEEGMTQYLVADGRAGMTFERGHLAEAVAAFEREAVAWSPAEIEAFADRFSVAKFRERMHAVVEETQREASERHRPEWADMQTVTTTERERELVSDGGGDT